MSYGTFVTILITGMSLSAALLCIGLIRPRWFSWYAIPLPFSIAWVIATWPYVRFVLEWHQ